MKVRHVLVAIATLFAVVAVGVPAAGAAPAAAANSARHGRCVAGIPEQTPAMDLLAPTSPTTVHAGDVITVEANWIHVPFRPSATLIYRGHGQQIAIPLDIDTFTITVPAGLRHGHYRLVEVVSEAAGTGEQFRNHRYVGTTATDPPQTLCGHSDLDLGAMDLQVVKG